MALLSDNDLQDQGALLSMPLGTAAVWSCHSRVDEDDPLKRYGDVLGSRYSYDSNVPNHLAVSQGDVLVIGDAGLLYGHGTVTEVTSVVRR